MTAVVENAKLSEQIEIDSAGTIGYHTGNGPDKRMSETLKARGYRVFGAARQIKTEDLEHFDLILTMDEENFANVRSLDLNKRHLDKIRRFTDFCQQHDDEEVPDPYYGGQDGFEHVANLVEDGCSGLLEEIQKRLSHS